ncbi:MAG TPA: proton-conducting transporter membrane subunit [Bryobacteraceae bacterium]|nr:proton-conducting transporter membrane subunit [Bryobacteraceae bacterium]
MLPVLPVALPLLTAAVLAALSKVISERLSQLIAIASTLTVLAANLYLLKLSSSQPIVYWFGNWRPRHGLALGISFVIDPIGAGLGAFAALLTVAAFLFSSEYFDSVGNHFHALMLAFLGSLCGFSLTGDLFNLFVFFELMSAAGFALCGYKTDDPGSVQGALNFAVTNTIAAYFVLTGIGLIYSRTSALNLAQIGRSLPSGPLDALVLVGFVFLVCGYLVKAAIVPFHFWLADAHAVAPTPVCVMFSGVMVSMGLFALARIYWSAFDPSLHSHVPALRVLFVGAGVITAFVGAFMCYIQRNLKRLLAFSTISHIGLMLIGIGLFSSEGLAGTAIYSIGHGLVKGSLFFVAGILLHRFKGIDEQDLHGKAAGQWATGIVLLLGSIGLAGIPFSGLAAGHDMIAAAGQKAGMSWLSWVFVFAGAVTSAAVLRTGGHIFLGWGSAKEQNQAPKHEEKPETKAGHGRTPATMFLPAAGLAVAGLSLGALPCIQQTTFAAADRFENSHAYVARVLDAAPFPTLRNESASPDEWPMGLLTAFAGLAIAAADLATSGKRTISAILAAPIDLLHRLHSGHIGDYVTFLVLGMGSFALVFIYCLR